MALPFIQRPLTAALLLLFVATTPAAWATGAGGARGWGWNALPIVGRSAETGWIFGGLGLLYPPKEDSTARGTILRLDVYGSTEGQAKVAFKPDAYLQEGSLHVQSETYYAYWPAQYFGQGPVTGSDSGVYVSNAFHSENNVEWQLLPGLWLGPSLTVRFDGIDWKEQGDTLFPGVPGGDGANEVGLGGRLSWDARDNANAASSGVYASLEGLVFPEFLGSSLGYRVGRGDLRGYLPLPWNFVAAAALFVEQQGGDVPFHRLSTPDGGNRLRGFVKNRYRDMAHGVASAEIRSPMIWRLGGTLFGEVGRVDRDLSSLASSDHLMKVVGVGGRFALQPGERLNIRVDLSRVAVPDGLSTQLTLDICEAF